MIPWPSTEHRDPMGQTATGHNAAALLRGYSVEVTSRNRHGARLARQHLAPGSAVYLASVRGDSHHAAAAAAALSAAGFVAVPHVAARGIASYTRLDDLLARLSGEAGVIRALVIGGDLDEAAGPYHSAFELLRTGLFARHGILDVGVACHVEPHRRIGARDLDAALSDKLGLIAAQGMQSWLVSQFCFDASLIVDRARRLREAGITATLRVGIAGPADQHALLKYALHCGIGNSIRALGTHADVVANLMARRSPDGLVQRLADAVTAEPELGIEGIHIFTFGGVAATARWANAILGAPGGSGATVRTP